MDPIGDGSTGDVSIGDGSIGSNRSALNS